MPDMSLAAQARRRLQAEGAPISEQNLKWAIQELELDPKLREDASSENAAIAAMGGHLGQPDTYKPTTPIGAHKPSQDPGNQQLSNKEMSPLRPDSGPKDEDQFFTADSQFGSNPLANTAKAKAARAKASEMANADRKSGVMFKGGQGATPGTTSSSVSTESVDNTTHDTAPIPKVTATDTTASEVNQLASRPRPRPPATQGAGQGGQEQVAAAATPTPATPPAQPTSAPPAAQSTPAPSVPVAPGATRLQPTTAPDWPGSTRWSGPSVTMPIPGAPSPTMLATPTPGISPAVAAPIPPGPAAPGMMSQIGSAISSLLGGLPTIPPAPPPIGGGPIGGPAASDIGPGAAQAARVQAMQTMAPRMGGDPGPASPLVPPDIAALPGRAAEFMRPGLESLQTDIQGQIANPHIPALPPQIGNLLAPPAPRLPSTGGMNIGDLQATTGGGVQGKPSPSELKKKPRRGSLGGRARANQGGQGGKK